MKPERERETKPEPPEPAAAPSNARSASDGATAIRGPGGPSHEVILLGKKYKLRSPHDDEYLAKLAHFVSGQVAEVQRRGAVSTMDAALLAALNIADEYFRFRHDAEQRLADVGEKTQALLSVLDEMDAKAGVPAADAPVEDVPADEDEALAAGDATAVETASADPAAPRKVDAAG